MLIEFLSGLQIFLCFSLIAVIYFSKPDTSGLSSLAQSFNSNNSRQTVRFRPVTKLIFMMVIMFFGNSLVLNKLIAFKSIMSQKISIIDKIDDNTNLENEKTINNKNDESEKIGNAEKADDENSNGENSNIEKNVVENENK